LGSRPAADVTPQELERWLRAHCKTPATSNRYKAFISLCFREGIHNGKVTSNPARQVRSKRESLGRLRYLTRKEYDLLCTVILARFPTHLAEFVVSVNTGMRLSEQYSLTWGQVNLERRTIDLTKTKNGSARTVHLNADAVVAFESIRLQKQKSNDPVFPRQGATFDTRSWFHPSLEDAKIEKYVWHSNRHTFCSWLSMAGASIKEIQELAGHKSIVMSARYSHLSPEHRLSVVERIAGSGLERTATKTATCVKVSPQIGTSNFL
jgi:integrase